MKVEYDKDYICLEHNNLMLIVHNDGTMLEGHVTNKTIRVDLTIEEKRIVSNMWKSFINKDYLIA